MFAAFAMSPGLPESLFSPAQLTELDTLVRLDPARAIQDFSAVDDETLGRLEILVSSWGTPRVDAAALARMPRLRAVVHAAGTMRFVAGDELWDREDIVLTSATAANSVPVAEYALAQILLAGKRSLRREATYHEARRRTGGPSLEQGGNYGSVVGLIGASHIGRLVAEHLRPFDIEVLVADPFVDAEEIAGLGARKVELEELFAASDVVSLHAPDVPSTRGMVSAELLGLMRDGTTFLNTARPALVDIDALRAEALSGRLSAVLDVHDQLDRDDPLWDCPTVAITPHIAGSQGNELHRMAESALEEVRRVVDGRPPLHPVDRARREIIA